MPPDEQVRTREGREAAPEAWRSPFWPENQMLCKRLRCLPNAHGHLLNGPGSRLACESVRFWEAAALLWEGLEPTSSHTVPPNPTGPRSPWQPLLS